MLLHADNFGPFGGLVALMLNGIYAENSGCDLVVDPDGVSPGYVLRPGWDHFNNVNTNWRYVIQTGPQPKVGVAFRIWNSNLPDDNSLSSVFAQWRDNANNVIAQIGCLSTGVMRLTTFSALGVGTNHDTLIPVVSAQGWYHTETWLTHTGVGTFAYEMRIESVSVLAGNAAGVRDTDIAQLAAYHVEFGGHAQQYFMKHLVICDGTGADNNDFVGTVLVTNLVPTSDVALNWGLTGGANGHDILSAEPPDDAKFIYALHSAPPAGPYVAGLSDLPVDTTSVKGLITYVRAAKTDGGDGSLQVGVVSTGSTGLGANRPITIAETYWRDVQERDPHTAAPWLPSAVNLVELQIDRTT